MSHPVLVLLREPVSFGLKGDNIELILYGLALSAVFFRTHAVVDRLKIMLLGAQQRVHAMFLSTHCFEACLKRVGGIGARRPFARGV